MTHYEARCQACGFITAPYPIEEKSLIAMSIRRKGFFNITCLDPCPDCGQKAEWTVYELHDDVENKS